MESNLLVADIQQSNLEALSGVIALRKELENDLQVEKDIAEEEEVEVAEAAFKTFDLKNENDDLAVNIIRHFDFSKVGIFAQTNQAPLPNISDIDNLESLHSTLENERDHF